MNKTIELFRFINELKQQGAKVTFDCNEKQLFIQTEDKQFRSYDIETDKVFIHETQEWLENGSEELTKEKEK